MLKGDQTLLYSIKINANVDTSVYVFYLIFLYISLNMLIFEHFIWQMRKIYTDRISSSQVSICKAYFC